MIIYTQIYIGGTKMEYLKNVLKKTGWMSLVESVIFAIIGLVLIQNPEGTVKFMSYLLGAIFILVGVYKIVVHVMEKQNGGLYNYSFVYGIMAVVIGIITIAFLIITLFTPNLDLGLPDISIMSYYQNFPTGVISLTDVAGPLT